MNKPFCIRTVLVKLAWFNTKFDFTKILTIDKIKLKYEDGFST